LIIPAGATGTVTQTLGGNLTLQVPSIGALVRIQEKDLGALHKEGAPVESPPGSSTAPSLAESLQSGEVTDQLVLERLKTVFDPEIPVNVVDLGLVYDVQVSKLAEGNHKVNVKMTLTAQGCGMGPSIAGDAQMKILGIPNVDEANVELVWDPPWNPSMISPEGKKRLGLE
jgi:probable FeS assembly SUF system protein SufT